jgi:hypothetical protein
MINGVIVPVLNATAEWSIEACGEHIDAGFDESSGHEQLLAPGVAAVAIAGAVVFASEVEGIFRGGVGEQCEGLLFEFVEGPEFSLAVEGAVREYRGFAGVWCGG